ncbi:protein gamete expressed 2 isoform X1 [Tanacetum coccineum]
MPHQLLVRIAIVTFFMLPNLSISDDSALLNPTIIFQWVDFKDKYRVGEIASIKVIVLKDFKTEQDRHLFNPNVSMNGVMGNSSVVTGLSYDFGADMRNWRIRFIPIKVGSFNLLITDDKFIVMDPSLHYFATPGEIYELGGIVSWMGPMDNFIAGMTATVLILPKDAFSNNVTSESEGQKDFYDFEFSANFDDGSYVDPGKANYKGWNKFGYLAYEFVIVTSGTHLLHVKHKNKSLIGSPLRLEVRPGALDVGNCMPEWSREVKSYQLSSKMETFIHQRDNHGNLVPGLHEFDIQVLIKGTKLSYPISDMRFMEISPGIQSLTFTTTVPGDFSLTISDKKRKKQIMNMPYEFNVFVGYCDGVKSIVNGSGLTDSFVGKACNFSIFLRDAYDYSAPLDLEKLQVEIRMPGSLPIDSQIYPRDSVNGTPPIGIFGYGVFGQTGIDSIPSFYPNNNSSRNWQAKGSDFDVVYVPEKQGDYEIRIFCGNIPLNDGQPFVKNVVGSGEVNLSISQVLKYDSKLTVFETGFITVKLMDSYHNPVMDRVKELYVDTGEHNIRHHGYPLPPIQDNTDGTYTGGYFFKQTGNYELCVLFNRTCFLPNPLGVIVHGRAIYPTASDDRVDVWEDQSIGFYPLGNDFFVGGNAKIVEFQPPSYGSVLQYGDVLRYTPYKGYYGSDTFMYTFSDVSGDTASASVNIEVVPLPPQFVSSPISLQATEDALSPKFGGFPSFMLAYSNSQQNISVKVSAKHGKIFLSPLLMRFWDPVPMWNELSVSIVEENPRYMHLVGTLEIINFAIQSLQYIGEEHFSGNDNITLSASDINGHNDLKVQIIVEPINDPPFINVPNFIILENEKEDKGFLLFDRERDKFNFSIGDPDLLHFPGNKTHFRVMFSVEVSSGYFSAKLPANLISTTELKLKNRKQWQPLITFVQISSHFTVKAKGIRFLGTIDDCNMLLHRLTYFGGKQAGVIRVRVNDMGWYGRCPYCAENMSTPLITEATINLITRMPMNPVAAHSLGSVILIESLILSLLALILMFFTCKCVIVLLREKKKQVQSQDLQLAELKKPNEQRPSTDSSENMNHLGGNFPGFLTQIENPSYLPKPVEETDVAEVATMNM